MLTLILVILTLSCVFCSVKTAGLLLIRNVDNQKYIMLNGTSSGLSIPASSYPFDPAFYSENERDAKSKLFSSQAALALIRINTADSQKLSIDSLSQQTSHMTVTGELDMDLFGMNLNKSTVGDALASKNLELKGSEVLKSINSDLKNRFSLAENTFFRRWYKWDEVKALFSTASEEYETVVPGLGFLAPDDKSFLKRPEMLSKKLINLLAQPQMIEAIDKLVSGSPLEGSVAASAKNFKPLPSIINGFAPLRLYNNEYYVLLISTEKSAGSQGSEIPVWIPFTKEVPSLPETYNQLIDNVTQLVSPITGLLFPTNSNNVYFHNPFRRLSVLSRTIIGAEGPSNGHEQLYFERIDYGAWLKKSLSTSNICHSANCHDKGFSLGWFSLEDIVEQSSKVKDSKTPVALERIRWIDSSDDSIKTSSILIDDAFVSIVSDPLSRSLLNQRLLRNRPEKINETMRMIAWIVFGVSLALGIFIPILINSFSSK